MTIIAAVGERGEIGRGGDLCWHIREDLKHFKALTTGHAVIMGRKTWESLKVKPLPGRRNIVVSTTGLPLEEALKEGGEDAFIIGGESIYRQTLPIADTLEITRILATDPEADTYFPEIDPQTWRLAEQTEDMTSEGGIKYRFEKYCRR